MRPELSDNFPRYTEYDPDVPVWCITPSIEGCFHRFFDTSPISPSGRYMAVTRMLDESHPPEPGEPAEVVVINLQTGDVELAFETFGWDTQMGAHAQWGASDEQLFFNDMDTATWQPFAMKVDVTTGEAVPLDGTVYMASPDGKYLASSCLLRTGATQAGYGVVAPEEYVPQNHGAADDDGIYVTDTETGEAHLAVSHRQIADALEDHIEPEMAETGNFYGFHVKWSPDGERIQFVWRWLPHDEDGAMGRAVVTCRPDGSEIYMAIPFEKWRVRGHHPNWCPDSQRVMMNLTVDEVMRMIQVRYDGSNWGLLSEELEGSGHPAMHPDMRHIVTDVYEKGRLGWGDGTVPIRLLDLQEETSQNVVRANVAPEHNVENNQLRVDPHPAWDYSHTLVTFNVFVEKSRRVFVADLSELL
ncbi:MAG: hypothetical protein R6V19_08210 [Armatimonadota bacterium]